MGYRVKEIIFFVKAWGDRSLKHSVLCRFCNDFLCSEGQH